MRASRTLHLHALQMLGCAAATPNLRMVFFLHGEDIVQKTGFLVERIFLRQAIAFFPSRERSPSIQIFNNTLAKIKNSIRRLGGATAQPNIFVEPNKIVGFRYATPNLQEKWRRY
ncbi:MAG: hypothetical protein SXA11_25540 [Cyanobacteriota bacterium]|nr:hypothetical protein [Cyanobacteriota bacterium]